MRAFSTIRLLAASTLLALFPLGVAAQDDEIVVVVSRASDVRRLTVEQVADIFLGATQTFPGGVHALPVDLPEASPLRTAFYDAFAGKSPAQMKMHWARLVFTGRGQPPRTLASVEAVKAFLATHPNAIAYMSASHVDDRVRIVRIDGANR